MTSRILALCAMGLVAMHAAGETVLYVDDDAAAGGDGATWNTAFNTLQDALLAAGLDTEVRVAQGLYWPDRGGNETPGDREAAFELLGGVSILGGYAGIGAADPDERDITLYPSILSGDLAGDDGPDFANNGENSHHVVEVDFVNQTVLLDGFTITAGNADGDYPFSFGGGVYCLSSSAVFIDCTFTGNCAYSGGAMASLATFSRLYNCRFIGNVCGGAGAGGEFQNSSPVLVNCLFAGNSADYGAALRFLNNCYPEVVNCVFTANSAQSEGGAVQVGGPSMESRARIANCVFWTNTAGEGSDEYEQIGIGTGGAADVDFCCIEDYSGLIEGIGNIAENPLFVDIDGPDDIAGNLDDDLHLAAGSPCIDAGNDMSLPIDASDLDGDGIFDERVPVDLDGNPRFADDAGSSDSGCGIPVVVDIGVFEIAGDSAEVIYGDVNDSGHVNIDDLFEVLGAWGVCEDCCPGDVNGSGKVDIDDLFEILAYWG